MRKLNAARKTYYKGTLGWKNWTKSPLWMSEIDHKRTVRTIITGVIIATVLLLTGYTVTVIA